jgi:hypothetical protein
MRCGLRIYRANLRLIRSKLICNVNFAFLFPAILCGRGKHHSSATNLSVCLISRRHTQFI